MIQLEQLEQLPHAHGPSGDESAICEVIRHLALPYADEVTVDVMGNLMVHKQGTGAKVMLSAHMDSIGFIVTHIEKEGFLRVGQLGGVAPSEALYTPVKFKNGTCGVVAKEEKAKLSSLKLDECYLDIGADSEEAAKKQVQVGDTAVYDMPTVAQGDCVRAPYLDNRISCAILLEVLSQLKDCPNDVYFVFSAQEEVGLRGAKTAAWGIAPDYALAVDVTDVDDTPGSEQCGTVQLGKGAAIKVMDRSVICHPKMVHLLEQVAQEHQIPVQKDILKAGGTDAGAIHTTKLGVVTGGVSVPCRYIHTPTEMVHQKDVQNCVDLLLAVLRKNLNEV